MSVGRYLIILVAIGVVAVSCNHSAEKTADDWLQSVVESWVQTEALHQKLSAEGKYKDSIRCLKVSDGMSVQERDSLMKYWSEHPEELRQIVTSLIDKK